MNKKQEEQNLEQKVVVLEEKILFQEDTIQKLDDVVAKQYGLIEAITRRLKNLEDKHESLKNEMDQQPATVIDEKPPHY